MLHANILTSFALAAILFSSNVAVADSQGAPPASAASGSTVDCSEAYGGKSAMCSRATCVGKLAVTLGTWKGDFQAYVQSLSKGDKAVFRPYVNTTAYSAQDCFTNAASGETFAIGRMTDVYAAFDSLPAKTERGLLIVGTSADGARFMRTVEAQKSYSYRLKYENAAASLSVWELTVPAEGQSPAMTFTTVDARDFEDTRDNKRHVTVTLLVGPPQTPYFNGVVAFGSHTLQKTP